MNLRRKAERFLRRLFHRKRERFSSKAFRKLLDIHDLLLKMREQASNYNALIGEKSGQFTIDGQSYEAAVEKFTEIMKAGHPAATGPIITWEDVSIIRVSKIPELLLLLGVRIRG